jgi:hypothetical protein
VVLQRHLVARQHELTADGALAIDEARKRRRRQPHLGAEDAAHSRGEGGQAQGTARYGRIDIAAHLTAAAQRIADLFRRRAAALERDVHDADLAVDRNHQVLVAERIGARRSAQHLAEIDALQAALKVECQRVLGGIDGAVEIDGAAVELAGQLGDLEQTVLQACLHVGVGDLERG